jgi:hypothetical protein
MKLDFVNVDNSKLGDHAKKLVIQHIENPKMFCAEIVLASLVNECFKQEIQKIRGS